MTKTAVGVIHFCLYLSVAMSLMALLSPAIRRWRRKRGDHLHFNADTVWIISFFVLLATWALRYAVGYYRIVVPAEEDAAKLAWYEEVLNSIVHALQTFSMDEDYTEYITDGRAMMAAIGATESGVNLYGAYTAILNMLAPILGGAVLFDILLSFLPRVRLACHHINLFERQFYFSELNERALALAKSLCDRAQYNEGEETFRRPLIVFTDAYTDRDEEASAELREEARALGAICLKEDLLNIISRPIFNFRREYILIDVNELDNVRTLAELASEKHWKKLKRSVVRIFYQDDSFSVTERQIIDGVWEKYTDLKRGKGWSFLLSDFAAYLKLSTQERYELRISAQDRALYEGVIAGAAALGAKKQLKALAERAADADTVISSPQMLCELLVPGGVQPETFAAFCTAIDRERALADMPAILRIRSFQHIIYQMLRDLPLYRPLFDKAPDEDGMRTLNVGIIGFGGIGMEMLLASAWFGQMNGVKLTFQLVSAEEPEEMMKKLNRRAPELLHSASPGDPVLRMFKDDPDACGERYFTFRCAKADVMLEPLDRIVCREYTYAKPGAEGADDTALPRVAEDSSALPLLDCDYFLVSTGKDDRNIELAEQLRRAVNIRRMQDGIDAEHAKDPLVTVAYVVYDTDLADTLNTRKPDGIAELVAVGSSKDIYSRKNMMLTDSRLAASEMQKLYNKVTDGNGKTETSGKRTVRANVKAQMHEEMKKRSSDIYSWMSSTARGMHLKYKAFSVWQFLERGGQDAKRCETLRTALLTPGELLRAPHADAMQIYCDTIDGDSQIEEALTWLEHRRWNAYMRSCGFQCRYDGKSKNLMLRLHPMIVEIKPAGSTDKRPDLLDDISEKSNCDYKEYDKPLQ